MWSPLTWFQLHFQCHQGDLRISGCYQPVAGKMVFNILEAKNLPKVSLMGTISEYALICPTCSLTHCYHVLFVPLLRLYHSLIHRAVFGDWHRSMKSTCYIPSTVCYYPGGGWCIQHEDGVSRRRLMYPGSQ